MKKMVDCVEVANEGLIKFLGERITLFCMNYFYTGKLIGVNDDCVLLSEPSIVYETGDWATKTWANAAKLPNDIYVMKASIEAFGIAK
jgi:hypothetical protein